MVEINDNLPVGYDRLYEGFFEYAKKEFPELMI